MSVEIRQGLLDNYESYVNPLNCDLSFMKCKTFLYFIVGTILFLAIGTIMYYDSFTGAKFVLSMTCVCALFLVCSLILLNLCLSNPSMKKMYSYITIGIFAALSLIGFLMIKK